MDVIRWEKGKVVLLTLCANRAALHSPPCASKEGRQRMQRVQDGVGLGGGLDVGGMGTSCIPRFERRDYADRLSQESEW